MEKPKEHFLNLWPLYTRHAIECGDVRASYSTYFFGILAHVIYKEPGVNYSAFFNELERRIEAFDEEKPFKDALELVFDTVQKIKNNVKKPDYTW